MGNIRVLPEFIANKIAAGEVVERPASIVKELVENSLDAGATAVEIEIQHGGRSLIRVSDDGCGMSPEDAKLAFQRHATSKISEIEDLETIASFGFRGEALPSIAAVSRCRLITRPDKASAGTEIAIEGGAVKAAQEHPCRKGTIVEVRDLFFNTPARRKFLKAESTELGHTLDVVSRMALSARQVQFTLRASDRVLLDLPPAATLLSRAISLLGEEASENFLELEWNKEGIKLSGLLGKPSVTRGNRKDIHLFVNRRWVKSLPLSYAIQDGYHGRLMEARYPAAVLFVDLDPKRVDVNVHPTKQEVRISREPEIAACIRQAVDEALSRSSPLPVLSGGISEVGIGAAPPPASAQQAWGAVMDRPSLTMTAASQGAALLEPIAIKDRLRITRILGQIHRTFLVVETEDGFAVMDQHAAHERVVFEALLKNLKNSQAERQMLFLEEMLNVHPRQRESFQRALPLLNRLGFDLELFGEGTWIVRAYPAVFGEADPLEILRLFLDQVEEGKIRTALEEAPEAVAALCACKRQSVKAGEMLDLRQVRTLLESLTACENPFHCPHGRPVFFSQSVSQLDKQFKRV